MGSGMWNSIQYITTGLTLIGFIVAGTITAFRFYLQHQVNLIKAADENDRAELIKRSAEFFEVNTDNLTKSQQYEVVMLQITSRGKRFSQALALAFAITVVLAILSYFAIKAAERPIIPLSGSEAVIAPARILAVGERPFYLHRSVIDGSVYVANNQSNYISKIALDRNPPVKNIDTECAPHDLEFLKNGDMLVACQAKNRLLKLSQPDWRVQRTWDNQNERLFNGPDDLTISPDEKYAAVTNWTGSTVTVIDLTTGAPHSVQVHAQPSGAAFSVDGQRLFVAHTLVNYNPSTGRPEGVISVVDIATFSVVYEIWEIGRGSADLKLDVGGRWLYSANNYDGTITKIDVSQNRKATSIRLPDSSPVDMALSKDGRYAAVANLNHPRVHLIDLRNFTLFGQYRIPEVGAEVQGIEVDWSSGMAFLTSTQDNSVVAFKLPIN